jgi:hypothetical protein
MASGHAFCGVSPQNQSSISGPSDFFVTDTSLCQNVSFPFLMFDTNKNLNVAIKYFFNHVEKN